MLFEGQVGPQLLSSGSVARGRLNYDGSVVTQDGHARYQEAVLRGNVFFVADQTGASAPAGLSTAPINVTLFNPKGNNKNAAILYAAVVNLVANVAAATVWIGVNTNIAAAATTGTAATPINALLGNANRSTISAFTTATLPAAPVAACVLGAALTGAITVATGIAAFFRWFDGALVLGPGASASFQFSTATAAASSFGEWAWEEVPVTV